MTQPSKFGFAEWFSKVNKDFEFTKGRVSKALKR